MTEILAADIGGTHARFAIADLSSGGLPVLADERTLATADYSGPQAAATAYAASIGRPLPASAAIAFAGPMTGDALKLTNSHWILGPRELERQLGFDRLVLVNDFAAVAHAVAHLGEEHFRHLCGPDHPLPQEGVITVVGPGTGLGVAQLVRHRGHGRVLPTEGGHIGFSPADPLDDRLLAEGRRRFGRVSAERFASGPGLALIHETLGGHPAGDDRSLWTLALGGGDPLAVEAVDRFCFILGSVAGDLALAHGAAGVVIAGGLGLRLADRLPGSPFGEGFRSKGRFQAQLERLPVRILIHEQPGLIGAAAAFAAEREG